MKKKLFPLSLFLFLIVLASLVGFVMAQEVPSYQDKYVNDFANVLDASQISELKSLFSSVDQETTAEVVFVSLDSIGGEDISQYSVELAQTWKVGKADKDNGLVILYVKDIGKIWVSTGYGLEGILPDSKVGRLLDENYVPLRDSGNVSSGIISFSNSVAQVIYENKEEVLSGQANGQATLSLNSLFFDFVILVALLIIIVRVLHIFRVFGQKKKNSFWFWPIFLPSNRSFGGGGAGGGGFGGGGFGGGGAGR